MIVFQQQGKKVGGSSGYKIKMIIQFDSKYDINLCRNLKAKTLRYKKFRPVQNIPLKTANPEHEKNHWL